MIHPVFSAQVDLTGDISLSGGGLSETYRATEFHFHWGNNNNQGSEHTINAKKYPMEVKIHPVLSMSMKITVAPLIFLYTEKNHTSIQVSIST